MQSTIPSLNPATKKQLGEERKARLLRSGRLERKGLLKVSAIFVRNESQARTEGKGGGRGEKGRQEGRGTGRARKRQGVRLRQIALVEMKQSQTRRLESRRAEGGQLGGLGIEAQGQSLEKKQKQQTRCLSWSHVV